MPREYEAELIQDGIAVASVTGADIASVHREIMHYWMQYQQDGPTEIRWKNMGHDDFEALRRHITGC
jgi:hypothetical protein